MYRVGKSLHSGLPCIIYDGDSVLCEFPGVPHGKRQAEAVCAALNYARLLLLHSADPSRVQETDHQ